MKLVVSSSPHISRPDTTQRIMLDVIIALIPALLAATIFFGPRSLLIASVSIATCVIFEYICRKIMKRENTIADLSAAVTGLLFALNLPVNAPVWLVILGGIIAIVVVKQMFGGLGQNFVNPALFARIVLLLSFPSYMSGNWTQPLTWYKGATEAVTSATDGITSATDALTTATPLSLIKQGSSNLPSIMDMILGKVPGSIGETCVIALLLGAVYLMIRKVISPVIPVTYLATVSVISLIAQKDVLYQLLSGGLILGAFFMATDYATSPVTKKGKVVFAIGCGVLTSLIRLYGNLPEGVSYAIILMNILVPHIERLTRPVPFGFKARKRKRGA